MLRPDRPRHGIQVVAEHFADSESDPSVTKYQDALLQRDAYVVQEIC